MSELCFCVALCYLVFSDRVMSLVLLCLVFSDFVMSLVLPCLILSCFSAHFDMLLYVKWRNGAFWKLTNSNPNPNPNPIDSGCFYASYRYTPGKVRAQDKTRQDETRRDKTRRQDKITYDKTKQGQGRQGKGRQRQDKIKQDAWACALTLTRAVSPIYPVVNMLSFHFLSLSYLLSSVVFCFGDIWMVF
jgi:hypothetical protein